ncbi:hypothetical protein AB4Z48_03230 [Cupriavidus sp. 2TAF22]|uniref:hypothetical protein n=1 Tax=unclassified Cupriavidus TaxID=2640874 RepID=UPI003F92C0C2
MRRALLRLLLAFPLLSLGACATYDNGYGYSPYSPYDPYGFYQPGVAYPPVGYGYGYGYDYDYPLPFYGGFYGGAVVYSYHSHGYRGPGHGWYHYRGGYPYHGMGHGYYHGGGSWSGGSGRVGGPGGRSGGGRGRR